LNFIHFFLKIRFLQELRKEERVEILAGTKFGRCFYSKPPNLIKNADRQIKQQNPNRQIAKSTKLQQNENHCLF